LIRHEVSCGYSTLPDRRVSEINHNPRTDLYKCYAAVIRAILGTFPAIARQTCEVVVKTNRLDVGCILSETKTHPGPEQLDVTHPPEAGET
jgi:hypothetical protein